ncbi:MAG: PAS domain S-box protein [Caldimonas sp.]
MALIARERGIPDPVDASAALVMRHVRDHAMVILDSNGLITNWNEGVRHVFGWEEGDWIGQPVSVAFTPEAVAGGVPEQELRQAVATGRGDDDRWMMRKDGTRFFAAGSVTPIRRGDGPVVGYLKVVRDMTDVHAATREREVLLESERGARALAERQSAALHAAFQAIPDGVYLGTADGITECNQPALSMLGVESVEDLHSQIDDLGRKFRVRLQREGPLLDLRDLPFARALLGEAAVLETWATNVSTGRDVYIRGTAAPIRVDGHVVGAVAVNSDLTEHLLLQQKRQELSQVRTELQERDEELRALVDGVRDYAIFTVDVEGRISSWHEGAELMKGYTADEAIGMPFANLFLPEDRALGRPQQGMDQAARTGEYKTEGVRLRKDGSHFEAAVVLTALRGPKGELLGFLKLTQDVTQRKHQEREREELLHNAQLARRAAERASHAKDEFLATISHELRTPLGAILGWAHVLERGRSDAAGVSQGLSAITRNARAQVQLIEDLLDMNRIESGQLRLEMESADLAGVVSGAIDAIRPTADAKGIRLETAIDPALGVVHGDPGRLQQVVWNLLSNAIKFTPSGGAVTVKAGPMNGAFEISVRDTGQGIKPEFLARMFQRFQQEDASTTRRHGGLGIGLAIVRELTHLHGGSVRAESRGSGEGSTFVVTLPAPVGLDPARDDPNPGLGTVEAPGHHPDDRRLDGLTLLLIDDEPDARAIAEHVLRAAGARVVSAGSAQEGFDLFRIHRPQAILSDIGMPVHDGYDFVAWVRSLDVSEGGQTPAAAFTAYARPEDERKALAAGFQLHLVKPVEPDELVTAVANLVAR